jgi:LysM domain
MVWWSNGWLEGWWAWLEPTLMVTGLLALAALVMGAVRIRVRRRPRRLLLPSFARRIVALLGFSLSLSSASSFASGRPSVHPSRSDRPLPEAPWLGTSGFSPPHPLVPSKSRPSGPRLDHPAVHPPAGKWDGTPLFERAAQRREREQRKSPEFHPAGSPKTVSVKGGTITVARGDCLWTLAAEVLGVADTPRIDGYWRAIYRVNHRVVGSDPNLLFPGQVLVLPQEATG